MIGKAAFTMLLTRLRSSSYLNLSPLRPCVQQGVTAPAPLDLRSGTVRGDLRA